MNIVKDKFVAIHYTLKNDKGDVMDTSNGAEPLAYLHGNGFLIPGLEKALEGKTAGDKFSTVVEAKDAYGERNEKLVVDVPKDKFDTTAPIEVGMEFSVQTPAGPMIVKVVEINGDKIKVDGNHELAGKTLYFDIEVVEVRDPTQEELDQLNSFGGCGGCGGCGGDCDGNGCGNEDCDGCGGTGVCKNQK